MDFERQMSNFNTAVDVIVTKSEPDEGSLARSLEPFGHIDSVQLVSRSAFNSCLYSIKFATAEGASKARARGHGRTLDGHIFQAYRSVTSQKKAGAMKIRLSDEGCEALIKLYLLADKLQDLITANMIVDELIQFVTHTREIPKHMATSLAYESTARGSPLRMLLRGYWVYRPPISGIEYIETHDFPKDFLQDVATELLRFKWNMDKSKGSVRDECPDNYRYHQHDREHPKCASH